MLTDASQPRAKCAVSTPLGPDQLLLRNFHGCQELSRPFEFELEMLSADANIDPAALIDQPVTMVVDQQTSPVYFNGRISRFRYCGNNDLGAIYKAEVVPWLWFLQHTRDCRIFQKKKVTEVLEEVLSEAANADFDLSKLMGNYPKMKYCVQYRESDFDFVSRLMEEYGIYYFFKHENGSHTMVLADNAATYADIPAGKVAVKKPTETTELEQQITSWQHHYTFQPGAYAHRDYNFVTPSSEMLSSENTTMKWQGCQDYEVYDYHGRYPDRAVGSALARLRMEETEAQHDTISGAGTYRTFSPSRSFTVGSHANRSEVGRRYALTKVQHMATVGDSYKTNDSSEGYVYENRFEGLPAETIFRPQRKTPLPIVEGPQTAVVVGPPGEEIYPDKHGRVKVQFHWDRYGQKNENSSCWIRVSQVHAGKGWGGMDLPRIGEEVIVDFIEGDPDNPIITGRVYNGEKKPPFALPGEMTRSGLKTDTHKGSGSNEMTMDDTAGQEQIRTNAQYNMDTTVGNNQTLIVNVDRTEEIGNNDALTVGVDSTENVGNDKAVKVGNNMHVNVGNKLVMNAGSSITLKCGASKIHMNSGGVITITGTIITTAAAANAAVVAPLTQIVGGAMLTTVGGINSMNGGVCKVAAAGLNSISGGKVDVVASGKTAIKGGLITLN